MSRVRCETCRSAAKLRFVRMAFIPPVVILSGAKDLCISGVEARGLGREHDFEAALSEGRRVSRPCETCRFAYPVGDR
jgi:hypothetical protein